MANSVLFLAFDFPPAGGAGVQRSLKFVKFLPLFGWMPTILTVNLGFRKNPIMDETLLQDVPEGVEIIRANFPDSSHKYILEKRGIIYSILRSYIYVFPDILSPWMKTAFDDGSKKLRTKKYDIIYSTILPASTGVVGVKLSKAFDIPLVADFRDTLTTIRFYDYPTKLHWLVSKYYEKLIINNSSKIIAQTSVAQKQMRNRYSAKAKDICYISNGYDEDDFINPKPIVSKGKFRFVYCGSYNIGRSSLNAGKLDLNQGFKTIWKMFQFSEKPMDRTTEAPSYFFDALSIIKKEAPHIYRKIEVLFVGARQENTEKEAKKRDIQDVVRCTGYLPHKEGINYMLGANALILTHYRPLDSQIINCVPGKMYEYLRSYRPIFALLPKGDAYEIVKRSNLGMLVSQTNIKQIAKSIENLVENKNAATSCPDKPFISEFERKHLTSRLASLFDQVLEQNSMKKS